MYPLTVTNMVTDTDPDVLVFSGSCVVGLAILTSASAIATISVHDGLSAAGPVVFFAKAPIDATEGVAGVRIWCRTGCFVVTTGAGSTAQVGIE